MSDFCGAHRLPRAGVDPIDSAPVALALLGHMLAWPKRAETIVLLLDGMRRGISVLVVEGTEHPDALLDVIDVVVRADRRVGRVGALVVASVRPGGDVDRADVDRWLEASSLCAAGAIELVEWFVIGDEVRCPRDLLGEPPRWSR